MITYAILRPEQDEPLGYLRCAEVPTIEELADHLALVGGFADRDAFLMVNPGLSLGFAPLQ